ncbi:MAG TPA: hypothetical protein PKM13_06650 [Candidatus Bipolaricaulis anaerobius]|jgi:hypothetical protein|nr:hypothetical protein [Candidatus Bipolaricaulis anaerobius]
MPVRSMDESTPTDIKELLSETKVWHPLGSDSKTRIIAATFGTAGVGTVTIHATCELHPDEARAFARQIEGAATWLQERNQGGMFVRGAWIADPYTLPDEEFHKHFCCDRGGIAHDFGKRLYWCQYTGQVLGGFGSGPIPIPAGCPKRRHGSACAGQTTEGGPGC